MQKNGTSSPKNDNDTFTLELFPIFVITINILLLPMKYILGLDPGIASIGWALILEAENADEES